MAEQSDSEYQFTIEGPGDDSDTLTIPAEAIDMLREEDEGPSVVIGDFAMLMAAQQLHGAVHHGKTEASDELKEVEEATMDAFEQRFGQTFGEMTGHQH